MSPFRLPFRLPPVPTRADPHDRASYHGPAARQAAARGFFRSGNGATSCTARRTRRGGCRMCGGDRNHVDDRCRLPDCRGRGRSSIGVPANDRRVPADDRRVPADDRRVPADDRRVPADDRRVPADDRRVPADVQGTRASLATRSSRAPRPPGDAPRTPADTSGGPGDASRSAGDVPRGPGGASRGPGDTPRVPGRASGDRGDASRSLRDVSRGTTVRETRRSGRGRGVPGADGAVYGSRARQTTGVFPVCHDLLRRLHYTPQERVTPPRRVCFSTPSGACRTVC